MKKSLLVAVLASLVAVSSFALPGDPVTNSVFVSATIPSNLNFTIASSAYTLAALGVATPDTITTMNVKSNSKTSFTIKVDTLHAENGSFNAKATVIGTADGEVTLWPYKLYLQDGTGSDVELTPAVPAKTFTRKTLVGGDAFALKATYASVEALNLDAGTYTDSITITLTGN